MVCVRTMIDQHHVCASMHAHISMPIIQDVLNRIFFYLLSMIQFGYQIRTSNLYSHSHEGGKLDMTNLLIFIANFELTSFLNLPGNLVTVNFAIFVYFVVISSFCQSRKNSHFNRAITNADPDLSKTA